MRHLPKIAFIQPFGLKTSGGGARILRMLLEHPSPAEVVSIVSCHIPPVEGSPVREIHLPPRPSFGRIERTRFAALPALTRAAFAPVFRRLLLSLLLKEKVGAVHAVAHSPDSLDAFEVARSVDIPYFLSVHDDLLYTFHPRFFRDRLARRLARAWREAQARFVISPELGQEYCRRYGDQEFTLVTDGLSTCAERPQPFVPGRLTVYFMGLFHRSYRENFACLCSALASLAKSSPHLKISLICRCGRIPEFPIPPSLNVKVLPFAAESVVAEDIKSADLLYLPLPFGKRHELMSKYSLSTKMITYLGSGVPILFHGPADSAAGKLLQNQHAAVCVNALDVQNVHSSLSKFGGTAEIAGAALALATSRFDAAQIRDAFWSKIYSHLAVQDAA